VYPCAPLQCFEQLHDTKPTSKGDNQNAKDTR
jgi:hypothetical protein